MNRFNEEQLSGEEFIHETASFGIILGKLRSKGDWQGLTGYLLVNKRTDVVEGEFTVEFAAIRTMRELETELEAALENKTSQEAVDEHGEMSFPEMLERLAQKQKEDS